MITLRRSAALAAAVLLAGCHHDQPPPVGYTLPKGMVSFFQGNACPTGWADAPAEWAGRYAVMSPSGATQLVGTPLGEGENRATGEHGHSAAGGGRQVLVLKEGCNVDNACRRMGYWDAGNAFWEPENAALKVTAVAVPSGQTTASGTNAPYVALRACVAN